MSKRARHTYFDDAGQPTFDRKKWLARKISIATSKKFPYKDFGTAHYQRGTADNIARFGATYKSADAEQKALRKAVGYSGKGLYMGHGGFFSGAKRLWRSIPKPLRAIGVGAARQVASHYLGSGAYNNSNNLMVGGAIQDHLSNSIPQMESSGDETGSVRIVHREYVSDVYAPGTQGGSAVAFQNTTYPLNPGLQSTFLFLSQIAQNFDEYEFDQLIWHFRSTTTDIGNSTTGQCGTIIMSTNYNAASQPFVDKQAMLEYAHSHSCKVTEHMSHGVECDKNKIALANTLFTRSNPVVTNQDLKTYDHGLFQLAIANCPSAYNGLPIGELWVEYRVTLRKPKLFTSRGLEIDSDIFTVSNNGLVGTTTQDAPLGKNSLGILKGQQNNIGTLVTTDANGVITVLLPASYTGPLKVKLVWATNSTSTAVAAGLMSVVLTGRLAQINDIYTGTAFQGSEPLWYAYAPLGSGTLAVAAKFSYFHEFHVYARPAAFGVDNKFTMTFAGAVGTNLGQATLSIEQYQAFGVDNVNITAPTFINSSGTVTLP
ncbi:putative capsid protein [Boiling Springs Lake RNA-DNA hybrid virus]|uniref:putative capsid protein n=1 Tax=Boiling Springs Lake RNA-DNA hybrid virus TaxID=1379788 RepID=UPI000259E32E|nr:putative capsid protein [Boiling Springs Lake RNA-DNA hybrid virus]AFH77559.1 putative capsid protein [Boiling Springs Lake RNA-DNA hybrid virus]